MRPPKGTILIPLFVLCAALAGRSATAQTPAPGPENEKGKEYAPNIAAASDAAERAIKGFRLAPGSGLAVEPFAAEPMVANPVTFSIDERNRFFVAETYRYHAGVTDIRRHMTWLDNDLANRTVEDRLAMLRKYLGPEVAKYGIEHDRVRLVEDRDGDGKADRSTVFADGFNEILGGIGAGVLARGGNVWFACIPDLWRLRDTDGDGRADERRSLHRGYGVHVGFLGHDLHGLRFGPDGRLYFSIGDRGFNVNVKGGLSEVQSGTVLRCNPDGSDLEVFATGLRNPQELAFDEHGNLFTCDNNSDSGDKARWVYVVEGGDSGWRIHSGMGRSWQSTLRAETREAAEARLRELGYSWEWLEDGCLRATTPVLPAVRELAPGRNAFFNQLIAAYRGWKDSRNDPASAITFGDGTRLDREAVAVAIELGDELSFDVPWQQGDVTLVDNFVAMHGRRPFSGTRKVLAALSSANV